jgi:hypothetical protein
MKVEIEIPDPPEGWVFDGFRQTHVHELILSGSCWVTCHINTLGKHFACVKVKPLWEPSPELVAVLRPGWVARDRNDFWYWYKGKPMCGTHMWLGDSSRSLNAVRKELLAPANIPWDQSCFKIGEQE